MTRKMLARLQRSASAENASDRVGPAWTFLTNHAHVLLCIYRDSGIRLREVAQRVGITERMAQKIVAELAEAGYLVIEKQGRCNRYRVRRNLRLRHPLEKQHSVGRLLELLGH
jgi:DNA-binding MarR family transcriptional regulator